MRAVREVLHPVIVLEGPDGAGKTTLAEEIQELAGARYVHMTYRFKSTPRQFLDYQWAAMRLCLRLARDSPVVLDRWWMSDEVYGCEFRGSPTNPGTWRALDEVAGYYGWLNVLAVPSDDAAHRARHAARAASGGEMYSTQGRLRERYADWWTLMQGRDNYERYDLDSWPMPLVPQAARALCERAWDLKAGAAGTHANFNQLKPGR